MGSFGNNFGNNWAFGFQPGVIIPEIIVNLGSTDKAIALASTDSAKILNQRDGVKSLNAS